MLCKANFGDPGRPYGRLTSHPPTFFPSPRTMHRVALRNSVRAAALAASKVRTVFSTHFPASFVLNGVLQSRALPAVLPLLFLAHMRQQRPVRICTLLSTLTTSNEHFLAHVTDALQRFHLGTRDTSRTAASEVSSILESRIAGTSVGANVEETGRVLSEFHASYIHGWWVCSTSCRN